MTAPPLTTRGTSGAPEARSDGGRPPAAAYVGLVAAATAAIALATSVLGLGGLAPLVHLHAVRWWALAVAFGAAEVLPVHFEHRREAVSFSLSYAPVAVGLFALSPVGLISARLVGSALALVAHRRQPLLKLGVNVSAIWLETVVAIVTFRWALQLMGPTSVLGPGSWPALFGAVLAADAVQSAVLASAISLYQRHWERGLAASGVVGKFSAVVESCLGLVALTILRAQPAALLPLGVLVVMVLLSYRTHRTLREKHGHLEQLYDFTSDMGDALLDGRVAATLLGQARELMHAESAWMYLADQGGLLMLHVDRSGAIEAAAAGAGAAAVHAAAHAAGGPTLLATALGAGNAPVRGELASLGVREVLAAPLVGPSGTLGTLVVADRSGQVRRFSSGDLRLFATLANHASVSLENNRLMDRLRVEAAESEHQAMHDALTGLPNRLLFSASLEEKLQGSSAVAVLLLDLDRFKEVNDTLGHHNGDLLLQQVGGRLRSALRHGDVIARLGGDEFAILLGDVEGEEAAVHVANGIVALFERPFPIGDVSVDVGVSIGIAVAPFHGDQAGPLVQRADVAMYTAKADQSGVELYNPERDSYSAERLALVGELRQAITNGDLEVYFQPQIDMRTGNAFGAEALVRWRHPTRGLIPPDDFISIAEHTGLIRPLTELVLEKSLACSRTWRDMGRPLRVSVNISARSLLQPTLADDVYALLRHHGVPAGDVCLEVTETSVMADPRRTIGTLERLRALGLTVAIDDFGTGHSALAYIRRLPVGEIKIDKSFVMSMASDASSEAIVRTIVDLACNLELVVVAEGVETEEVRDTLLALGCPVAQGYLYSRPLPQDQMMRWLSEQPEADGPGVLVALAERAS